MLFSLISMFAIVFYVEAAEVYLTVKNEEKVACSENARLSVMLICEGVDLISLRWSYIGSNSSKSVELQVFLADHSNNITVSSNPAFLSVQLVTVSDMETPANFTSMLTVDLQELENQDITSITCGDVATYEEKLVSDIILDLVNTKITANYHVGVLTSIEVQLRNLLMCSSILMYTMTINGSDEAKHVRNCVGPFCEARFSSIRTSAILGDYTELTLLAIIPRKHVLVYRFPVGHRSKLYFSNKVNSTDCLHLAGCTVVQEGSICSIRHTVISAQPINGMTMLNIPYSIPGTVHNFDFSMEADKNLRVKENVSVTDRMIPFALRSTAILSTTSLYLLLTVIHFLLLFIGAFCKVKAFVCRKKSLIVSLVILLVLLFICICSIFVYGIISYGTQCSKVKMTLRDSMLDTMLVISCLGITILITIWSFIGYGVYKHRKFTLRFKNKNTSIVTTPSRKSSPSTLPKQGQHSNSVLYDEVGLAKVKVNVLDMTEVELKANESYGHTDKCNSQKDLSLSHQYSEIKVKPKAKRMSEHPELINIEQKQILLKSNQSYSQLTGVVGQIGGCELQHEYDYVDPVSRSLQDNSQ
ncbi:uncharacterized protein LOC135348219 isoform X3 [Halichondria panicea]|uniref:uncharacterized protein LOC135348219 isoform X3 n=1 Tax=Halichondria panicea TaxID=6063 RepID=UPI00312B6435